MLTIFGSEKNTGGKVPMEENHVTAKIKTNLVEIT